MNPAFHQPVVCVALGLVLITTSFVLLIVFSINDIATENRKTRDISVTLTCILGLFTHAIDYCPMYLLNHSHISNGSREHRWGGGGDKEGSIKRSPVKDGRITRQLVFHVSWLLCFQIL